VTPVDFPRQIFLLYFGKGNFGGKKFTWEKSESTVQSRFFQYIEYIYIYIEYIFFKATL
jgi:hypothetical protein